jgi:putative transposase
VPLGLKRLQATGHSHFVTFTCYRRMRHLTSEKACSCVVAALERTRRQFRLRVYGFVVMPEHVHLLVSEPERDTLERALQSLKISSARLSRSLRSYQGQTSALWQKRYYDRYMRDYEEFSQTLRYIHRNPVKRGLCARPEDWPWSSFRHYATGVNVGVEVESQWTARTRWPQA